jgi:hypothetical protein
MSEITAQFPTSSQDISEDQTSHVIPFSVNWHDGRKPAILISYRPHDNIDGTEDLDILAKVCQWRDIHGYCPDAMAARDAVSKQFNDNDTFLPITRLASVIPRKQPSTLMDQQNYGKTRKSNLDSIDRSRQFKSTTKKLCTALRDSMAMARESRPKFPVVYVDPLDWEAKTGKGVGKAVTITEGEKTRSGTKRSGKSHTAMKLQKTETSPNKSGVRLYLVQEDGTRKLIGGQGGAVSQTDRTDMASGSRASTRGYEGQDAEGGDVATNSDYTTYGGGSGGSALADHGIGNTVRQKSLFTEDEWGALEMDLGS